MVLYCSDLSSSLLWIYFLPPPSSPPSPWTPSFSARTVNCWKVRRTSFQMTIANEWSRNCVSLCCVFGDDEEGEEGEEEEGSGELMGPSTLECLALRPVCVARRVLTAISSSRVISR